MTKSIIVALDEYDQIKFDKVLDQLDPNECSVIVKVRVRLCVCFGVRQCVRAPVLRRGALSAARQIRRLCPLKLSLPRKKQNGKSNDTQNKTKQTRS